MHRTYLRADGSGKADVEPTKVSLDPVWGGAIRLHPHDHDRPLVIGEGIETSASAGIMLQVPAWSTISAGDLGGGLVLPPEVRDIIVAADTDSEGETRAHHAAWHWKREGRAVRIARPPRGASVMPDSYFDGDPGYARDEEPAFTVLDAKPRRPRPEPRDPADRRPIVRSSTASWTGWRPKLRTRWSDPSSRSSSVILISSGRSLARFPQPRDGRP